MKNKGISYFFHGFVAFSIFIYGCYWMYLCCGEHWRRSIGAQNLIFILFFLLCVFISLLFFCRNHKRHYIAFGLISFIPGIIVCFINRATRYHDFENLIEAFNDSHQSDVVCIGYKFIYSERFLQYDYIVTRSSTSSLIMGILQFIWLILIIKKILLDHSWRK